MGSLAHFPTQRFPVIPALLCLAAVAFGAFAGCDGSDSLAGIRQQQAAGKMAPTIAPLRHMIDENPSNPELDFLLGRALFATGETGAAIWPLRKAVESPEYAVKAGVLLTRVMLQSRFKEDGIRAAGDVLAIEPDNLAVLELRARAYAKASRYTEALADIDHILKLDPDNAAILAPRVLSFIGLEQVDEAGQALEEARKKLAQSEVKIDDATRAKLCVVEGMFTFERGDLEKADELYEGCIGKYPTDSLVVRQAVAMFDRRGQRERGTEVLKQALDLSKSSDFRAMLAQRMNALGESAEAEQLLRKNAEEKNSPTAWSALADYLVKKEDIDGALIAFEKAVNSSPRTPAPMLLFAYADTLIIAERYDEARAIGKELDVPALGELIEGRVRLGQGDPRGALESFQAGIKLWPDNPGARFLSGQAAEQMGDFKSAESEYRESVRAGEKQHKPTDAALYLARLQEARGNHALALERIGVFVRSHQTNPDGIIMSIRIAQRMGRRGIVTEGLKRLAKLPDQMGVAFVERERLLAGRRPPEAVIESFEKSGMDLTKPANAPALGLLIDELAKLRRYDEAVARAEAAVAAHPETAVLQVERARALRAAKRPAQEIRAAYERALELDPKQAQALTGLARVEADSGNTARAIELYDRASAADPTDSSAARAAIALMRDTLSASEFAARLETFLRRHPHSAEIAGELAQIVTAEGEDPARALALARQAAMFDSGGRSVSKRAFEAVADSGATSEAEAARSELERRAAARRRRASEVAGASDASSPSSPSLPPSSRSQAAKSEQDQTGSPPSH